MPTTLIYGKERNTSDARILIQTERLYGVNPGEIRDRLTLGKAPLVPEKIALARRDLPSLQAEPRTRQQALKLEVALFALAQAEKYGLPSDWRPGPRNGWTSRRDSWWDPARLDGIRQAETAARAVGSGGESPKP